MKHYFTFLSLLLTGVLFSQTGSMVYNSFQHNGVAREYKLYVPANYDGSESFPLVFNLHGYTSNMDQQIVYGDFRSIADTANFLVVHPNGTFDTGGNRFWNAFNVPGVDDIGFLSTLIDTINNNYNVDLNRVYSTGMSNGGYMSFELACQLSNRIASVASVTGTMTTLRMNACSAQKPTPIMQIHGTFDPTVPYNGDASNESIPDVIDYWVNQTNCASTPVIMNVPDNDPNDGCTTEHYVYSGGDQGTTVEHYKVIDGAHTWPGAPVTIGTTSQDFNASIEIWRFFSQYSLDQLVGLQEELDEEKYRIYPNPSNGNVTIYSNEVNPAKLKVLDALGRTVRESSLTQGENMFELQDEGVYFLRIEFQEKVLVRKIIVE